MDALQGYESGSDGEAKSAISTEGQNLRMRLVPVVEIAPEVTLKGELLRDMHRVDPTTKALLYNPKYNELHEPAVGPQNPFQTDKRRAVRNILTGYVESSAVNDFQFEQQRRTFDNLGFAANPSILSSNGSVDKGFVGNLKSAAQYQGASIAEIGHRPIEKRKRESPGDPSGDNFKGPWRSYVDQKTYAAPSEEELAKYNQAKTGTTQEEVIEKDKNTGEERSTLHITEVDYQGRNFMHVPRDVEVDLLSVDPPERCFLPKKLVHTWTGHTKGVSAIRFFPHSAHLMLSCSMDSKIKLWEVYGQRRCARTYMGHTKAVRDISFSNDGRRFLSCGYDKIVKLWDTETGQCISRFDNRSLPYCVKFNPDEDKQHLFLGGYQNKKICQWDINSGEIVQEYDRHLGCINSITFVDENRRFVSTSDDKTIRVWEWDIPVDIKYIADPAMHSMPAVAMHPNKKWMLLQSMDNIIYVYGARDKFRQHSTKKFSGHVVAGYACQPSVSPDGSYVISGDSTGNLVIWDWKTSKLLKKMKAHDQVCIGVEWHPKETSKVATCSWDGTIKFWD